jgi:hypothetical protein
MCRLDLCPSTNIIAVVRACFESSVVDRSQSAETERRLVVVFRKCFEPALLVCGLALAMSCRELTLPATTVRFVTPRDGQRVAPNPVAVKVHWTASYCTPESVALFVNGAHVGTSAGSPVPDTCGFTWDATGTAPGTRPRLAAVLYYRYVSSGDRSVLAGDTASLEVLVDTGGPDIFIVAPQDGDTLVKGNVPITAWARDTSAAGMDRVEFLVDGELKGTATSGEQDTWRYTWDASQAGAGSHTIKAKAYNGYGEVAVEAIGVYVRDTASGGGPTYHHGYVDTSETWSPAGNPHIVDGDVMFRYGAWLTAEPGCVIRFDYPCQLYFGRDGRSGLKAIGRADAGILFTSNRVSSAPGDWSGLMFGDSTLAGTRLNYCTVEYGGYIGSYGAAIRVFGKGSVEEISNCTIRQSGMFGVYCMDSSSIGTFRENVVTANLGYALHIGPQLAELLDADNVLTGNDSVGVELTGRLSTNSTWPNLGVPYVILNSVLVADSTNRPVLTIEPGTEIKFKRWGCLESGRSSPIIPGRVVADGSAGRVRFTSAAGTPAPGDYTGVYVNDEPGAESEFRNCDFEYGSVGLYVSSNVSTITGCDFGYSSGWGIIFKTAQAPDTVLLRQVNTFHDNASGDIMWIPPFPSTGD